MTDFVNPVWGPSDTGLVHVVEAPPANFDFHPMAACGNDPIVGERKYKSDFPSDTEFCGTCEKLSGTGSTTTTRTTPTTETAKEDK